MNDAHYIHTSDWHLGFRQYNLIERENDFFNAAMAVVEKIITINPQFVLHTGDLFHHQNPRPETVIQAVKLFDRLRKAKIPVYMIRGNHDARISKHLREGGNIITLLDTLGFVNNIDDEVITIDDRIRIYGIGYYTGLSAVGKLEQLIMDTTIDENYMNIVAMHAFVEGQLDAQVQVSLKDLKDLKVDYIGMGHYHKSWFREDLNIFAPGCTETTSSNDWLMSEGNPELSMYTKFFEVRSIKNGNKWQTVVVQTHDIPVRSKLDLILDSHAKNLGELEDELEKYVGEKLENLYKIYPECPDPIIKLHVNSNLSNIETLRFNLLIERYSILHLITSTQGIQLFDSVRQMGTNTQEIENIILELIGDDPEKAVILSMITDLVEKYGAAPLKDPKEKVVSKIINTLSNGSLTDTQMREMIAQELNKEEGKL